MKVKDFARFTLLYIFFLCLKFEVFHVNSTLVLDLSSGKPFLINCLEWTLTKEKGQGQNLKQ